MDRTSSGHSARDALTTAERKNLWLDALETEVSISGACKKADVGRSTVYEWKAEDQWFAGRWLEIDEANVEAMEVEARRRAVEGVRKPIYHKDELLETVRDYSDQLLMFMLRAKRPDVYRDNARVTHAGDKDNPVVVEAKPDLSQLSPDDLRTFHALLEKAAVEDQMQ